MVGQLSSIELALDHQAGLPRSDHLGWIQYADDGHRVVSSMPPGFPGYLDMEASRGCQTSKGLDLGPGFGLPRSRAGETPDRVLALGRSHFLPRFDPKHLVISAVGKRHRSGAPHFRSGCPELPCGDIPDDQDHPPGGSKLPGSGYPVLFTRDPVGTPDLSVESPSSGPGCPALDDRRFQMGVWYPPGRSRVWITGFPANQAQGLPGRRELYPS
jgi:hypothetical protein